MKRHFDTKRFMALAAAMVMGSAIGPVSQAQEPPPPPSGSAESLSSNIAPGTPLAEVVKMVQANVEAGTIRSYVLNSQSPFNLDADKILTLKDEGVPSDLINTMMDRDKAFYGSNAAPAQNAAPMPVNTVDAGTPEMAPPTAEVSVNYFNDTLTPYGTWVQVEGYGRCWRPTVVNYESGWSPYGDRGHWVYTDYGWYWDSDYSWGATFHYGRWFRNDRLGWCWYPDTVWAPSWVTWRSSDDYCGWAPLPPFAVFRPGVGFFYRGASVSVDFDFGIAADCFVFVSPGHFCDRRPRSYFVAQTRVHDVYRQTRVINNFNVNHQTMVNRGIGVDHIASVTHRTIEPVRVSTLPNSTRQGWRGEGFDRNQHPAGNNNSLHTGANNNGSEIRNQGHTLDTGNGQLRHGPEQSPGNHTVNNVGNANTGNAQLRHGPEQRPQSGGFKPESYQSPVQNHSSVNGDNHTTSPNPVVREPSQHTQTANGFNAYSPSPNTAPSHTYPQNDYRQNFGVGSAAANGGQSHGAQQLQQQPRFDSGSVIRDARSTGSQSSPSIGAASGQGQGQSQSQGQSRGNSGGGSGNGSNGGSGRQNR